MKLSYAAILNFREMIFSWWKNNRRDLPWRTTSDSYRIAVSEIMLQQTQVSRVLPKYKEFLKAFPTLHRLAQASPAQVLRLWKGLGYNRRALFIHKLATTVEEKYSGKFPQTLQELTKLPGLGNYTARALLVFSYRKDVYLIDTNIRRIIVHYFYNGSAQNERKIVEVAEQLLPKGKSWEWHQALMDFGALAMKGVHTSNKKKAKPFRGSNRFVRGRIVDILREASVPEAKLVNQMLNEYDIQKSDTQGNILRLVKEGLIMISEDRKVALAE